MYQILFNIPSSWVLNFLTILQFGILAVCVIIVAYGVIKHRVYDWATLAVGIAVAVAIHFLRPILAGSLGPTLPVYSYGVMLVIGFFAAMQTSKVLARHSRIDPEVLATAALIALVSGVAGARISHVLENLPEYTNPHHTFAENLWNAVNIHSGGLTFYGGFLLATPCTIAYGIMKKVPLKTGMDIIAPCLMIGLGFGRIGCFLNGCCYGAECSKADVPWALAFPYHSNPYVAEYYHENNERLDHNPPAALLDPQDKKLKLPQVVQADPKLAELADQEHSDALHPSQLYSTITAWLIAAVLIAYYTIPHVPGRVFAMMLMIESPTRYVLEMLRSEPPVIGGPGHALSFLPPQSFSMVVSVLLFIAGVAVWFAFRGQREVPGDLKERPGVSAVPA